MEELVTSKSELLANVESAWEELNRFLDGLSDKQLRSIRDDQGWTIHDHVSHLTAWERSALFFLQGRPRHVALGVDEVVYLREVDDEINAAIHKQNESLGVGQTISRFREVHAQLMAMLEKLDDESLQQPYRHYLPDEPGSGGDRPAINVVYGNSAHHFREHLTWMRQLMGNA